MSGSANSIKWPLRVLRLGSLRIPKVSTVYHASKAVRNLVSSLCILAQIFFWKTSQEENLGNSGNVLSKHGHHVEVQDAVLPSSNCKCDAIVQAVVA